MGRDGNYVFRNISVGSYKKKPNHVKTVNGDIHYYADPVEVPARITDLLAWYEAVKDTSDWPALLVAAIFHHEFVAIHPFDDGNGRMGRILMNYTLMKKGYPPIVVPHKQRLEYYQALNAADDGNFTKLLNYLGQYLLISLKVQLEVAQGKRIYPYRWEES